MTHGQGVFTVSQGWEAAIGLVTIPLRDIATPEQHLFRYWKLQKTVRSWRLQSRYMRPRKKQPQVIPLSGSAAAALILSGQVPASAAASAMDQTRREVVYEIGGGGEGADSSPDDVDATAAELPTLAHVHGDDEL